MKPAVDNDLAKLIAIVEDDPDVARIIEQVLSDFAFRTVWCRSAADLLRRLRSQAPDLCIIDLGLPDMDGLEVMQRVRAQSACGIVILTGRAHVSDRVMGLELGADDYILKPFEPRELVARIQTVLRRTRGESAPAPQEPDGVVRFDGWTLHSIERHLVSPQGVVVPLSNAEFRLLCTFLRMPRRVFSRDQLMEQARGRAMDAFERSIDLLVSRLRSKLSDDPRSPSMIRTVRGAGYVFNVQSLQGQVGWPH